MASESPRLFAETADVGAQLLASRTRQISAACGVLALLALDFVPDGNLADSLALMALAAIGFATAIGWLELLQGGRVRPVRLHRARTYSSRQWLLATLGVVLIAGLAMQTWFRVGTSVAAGDTALPSGTAWLGRLSEPWTWTGFSLGEPSLVPLALPWAAILEVVHMLGGDPGLAQRVWYTTLFVGAGLGAFGLMSFLRLGPVAAFVGAVIYLFNPSVVSLVNTNAVYLAALCLLVAMPAALVAAGTARLSARWSAALLASAAPVLGYVFFNPPLVGMVLCATLATPPLVAWVDGKKAAQRSFRALLLAVPLLLAASAYWIVPALLHLSGFAGDQLASVSSWTWTEGRATIRNAFWLNTTWGWIFPEYFPYAATYEGLPLSAVRFVLPVLAFGALALGAVTRRSAVNARPDRELRLTVAVATVAVVVILISTGTNPPGNMLFDPLYNLPFGWLLREPGRFLMVAAAAYAVLTGVTIETLLTRQPTIGVPALLRVSRLALRRSVVPVALVVSVLLGFPLYTGAVVPDSRPQLPAAHVHMPVYWTEMAGFVDRLPIQGAVLVLPPDDFYGMPYSWGYYGADSFIPDLFQRPVLVPNPQGFGYVATSPQVMGAVNLTAQSILRHDWRQAAALVTALNTPLILVRRDIDTPFGGRPILPPADLARALNGAPNFVLIRQAGLLDLFSATDAMRDPDIGAGFTTIDTHTPDLRLLSMLPPRGVLVSHEPQAGVPNVVQAPPLELWPADGDSFTWQPSAPPGSAFRVAELESRTTVPLDQSGIFTLGPAQARIAYAPNLKDGGVTVSVKGRSVIANGDFNDGPWGPVSDCLGFTPTRAKPYLNAKVVANDVPGGAPALQLSTLFDSACVAQSIDWHGGPLLLSLMVNRVEGGAPRVCLWETGPHRCASLPTSRLGPFVISSDQHGTVFTSPDTLGTDPKRAASGWFTYRASVSPDVGTTALDLYLYADAYKPGGRTSVEYAHVRVVEIPGLATFALLANPLSPPKPTVELVVLHNTFSTEWEGSISGQHVLVDGMLNGWLIASGSHSFTASYKRAGVFLASQWVSLFTLLISTVTLSISFWVRRVRGRWSSEP